jgi:hypothetical protein
LLQLELLAFFALFAHNGAFGVKRNIWWASKRELAGFFDTASILLRNRFDTSSQNSEGVSKKVRSGIEESTSVVKQGHSALMNPS